MIKQSSILNFLKKNQKRDHSPSKGDEDDKCPSKKKTVLEDISSSGETSTQCLPSVGESFSNRDIGMFLNESVTEEEKHILLKNCWCPDDGYQFPKGKRNLKFQKKWMHEFFWIAYSRAKEGVFCKYCFLFASFNNVGKGQHQKLGAFVNSPFKNWKDAKEEFRRHEATNYHQSSCEMGQNFLRVYEGKSDNVCLQIDKGKKEKALENREKLVPIIKSVIFCGRQEISLRGHIDHGLIKNELGNENDGNFRALLRFRVDSGDEILKKHLETCNLNSSYLSPQIQNEIIDNCKEIILNEIVTKINNSKCFSVLADETTDISGVEQLSLCARYTEIQQNNQVLLREDFLKFVPVFDLRGESLATKIIAELKNIGLNLNYLKGQGYDGAAAMSGCYKGCSAVIRRIYPEALYIHCSSHALNLVLCHSCSLPVIRNGLSTMKEVINFFRLSPKKNDVLKKIINEEVSSSKRNRLIKFCETRWVEHLNALVSFKELFASISNALLEIQSFEDSESSAKAFLLANALNNGQLLITVVTVSHIFNLAFGLCKYLQTKNIDLSDAVMHVETLKEEIQQMRKHSEASFEELWIEAELIAKEIQMEIKMPRTTGKQTSRSNHKASEPKEYYRLTLFIPFLDYLLQELSDRFLDHKDTLKSINCLLPKNSLNLEDDKIKLCCQNLAKQWPNDVCDPFRLEGELRMWRRSWKNFQVTDLPTDFITSMEKCNENMFPTLFKILKISATLPITTATAERSFSTLRRLKSYLRSTTSQNRLNGLAHLSIHREIELTADNILDMMAKKPRRLKIDL